MSLFSQPGRGQAPPLPYTKRPDRPYWVWGVFQGGDKPRPYLTRSSPPGPYRVGVGLVPALVYIIMLIFVLSMCSCSFPGTQQAQQPDPRLKLFHVLSERIIMLDTQAEVDGTVQNTGHDRYPYDVTLMATFYNSAGNVIGQAQGVAEDVLPGMTRPFVLIGQVDSSQYSRMVVTPISLRERRIEKNTPTPPPVVP